MFCYQTEILVFNFLEVILSFALYATKNKTEQIFCLVFISRFFVIKP